MSPEAKAQELFETYSNYIKTFHQGSDYSIKVDSLICATIAVEEMLSLGSLVGSDLSDRFYIYWNSVKDELNNL